MVCQAAKELVKKFEGLRLTAYKCPAGVLTIGYGHTKNVSYGQRITIEQANALLDDDLAQFENAVRSLVKANVNENQIGALTSFAFNVGVGNLRESTLLKKLNAKDYGGAAIQFLRWTRANGIVLDGLVKRREAEKELFLTP